MSPEDDAEAEADRILESASPEVRRALRSRVLAGAVSVLVELAEEAEVKDRPLRHRPLQARPSAPRTRRHLAQSEEGARPSTRDLCALPAARPQETDRRNANRELKGSGLLPEPQRGRKP